MTTSVYLAAAIGFVLLQPLAAHAQQAPTGGSPKQEVVRLGPATRSRATLGINIQARPGASPEGKPRWADYPVVSGLAEGSPAAKVGIRVGDVILSVNGVDGRELGIMHPKTPGETYVLRIRRGSEILEFTMVSAPR